VCVCVCVCVCVKGLNRDIAHADSKWYVVAHGELI